MKNFILDSTYKDSVILDNNNSPCVISSHNLPNPLTNPNKMDIIKNSYNYIGHKTINDDLNNYSFIDYL